MNSVRRSAAQRSHPRRCPEAVGRSGGCAAGARVQVNKTRVIPGGQVSDTFTSVSVAQPQVNAKALIFKTIQARGGDGSDIAFILHSTRPNFPHWEYVTMKFSKSWMAAAAMVVVTGAAQAALVNRGGGMIYDTTRNITWLADMN